MGNNAEAGETVETWARVLQVGRTDLKMFAQYVTPERYRRICGTVLDFAIDDI
jgi:acyl-CoA hydrolase